MGLVDGLHKTTMVTMMETNVNYTIAGLFVISLITAIVFSVIWLSSGFGSEGDYTFYNVFMKESVSGLVTDGPVEFNGVNVGTVTNIKISHKNPKLVELLLKIKNDTPVTVATRAKFGVRALSGIGYILLEDKGTDMRPLKKSPDQEFPVIETVPSLLVRLDTTLTQLSGNFRDLTHSMQSLLDKNNLQSVKEILASTNATLSATKTTFQLLEARTIPLANQAISSLEMVTRDLSAVSAEMRQNPAILIRGKAPSLKLGPGEK